MKDHEDIKNHRNALDMVFELVRNKDVLRRHDVRSLHQWLLGQPFQANAQTPDGRPTRKWVYPGQYKDQPNHVVMKAGEKHYYASVEETPALLTELTDWLAANHATLHTLLLSALFHHAFSIHPFDDGNGRMTRLPANLVLMQAGFPPVIVRQQEREACYAALSQADAGEPLRFVEFIGEIKTKTGRT
ncbi:MAG: Fic family protein [Hymenobacteraceae bacterium]|nr:Fic family protein [Hymenobacteraceae bacterium]